MRALWLAAAFALAACGPTSPYPPQYRDAFLASCQAQGGSESHCACVFGKVEASVSRADFEAFDRAAQAGETHPLEPRIAEFSAQCDAP